MSEAAPTMARQLMKFLIIFDNSNLLFFPGQFLSGRVIIEVDDDMPVMGKKPILVFDEQSNKDECEADVFRSEFGVELSASF